MLNYCIELFLLGQTRGRLRRECSEHTHKEEV